jgi:hypothetical protein
MGYLLNGFEEPSNQEVYEALIQEQKDQLIANKKNDATPLFLIQQGLDESILPKVAATTRSKEAWNILEMAYRERGRNIDHHQAKSQSIAVDDGMTVVTKEVEEFDIAEIIGEVEEAC